MAFPTTLTNAVDGITDVMADHLNSLEAKVGIDGSLVTASLDYLLKNPGSVDPGHVHSGYQVAGSYITALTGDVAASGPGSAGALIQAGAVNLSKMANLAANSIIGNNTASPATPLPLSALQVKTLLAITQGDVTNLVSDLAAKLPITTYQDPASISPGHKHVNLYKPDGSAAALTADANGNIGIGTATPAFRLDVKTTLAQLVVSFGSTVQTTASNYILNTDTGNGQVFKIGSGYASYGGPGALAFYNSEDKPVTFYQGANERLRINSGGNVGIGTASPNASALLHLSSTSKGFLPPVMTTAQKAAISSPPAGLVVFDSTLGKLCVRGTAAWETITSA